MFLVGGCVLALALTLTWLLTQPEFAEVELYDYEVGEGGEALLVEWHSDQNCLQERRDVAVSETEDSVVVTVSVRECRRWPHLWRERPDETPVAVGGQDRIELDEPLDDRQVLLGAPPE
ncbi:hypothetical protein ER308_08940 [Egibacter rhizosphaerae]|uniref:Uncharacterized protein n=1 Tax=Egibacter rhizosphaerae TaxID=1670831 RepID=A0A411YEW8_9ACTN|nr:hypothetical protein [Egibacter rhizosphaerae]QBI19662.1 hypothetical protein ER308_08940 [Egibacter rhizosphaerae]